MTFDEAIQWHTNGKLTSPRSRSVEATSAILEELNRAIALVALARKNGFPLGADFVDHHAAAPYG